MLRIFGTEDHHKIVQRLATDYPSSALASLQQKITYLAAYGDSGKDPDYPEVIVKLYPNSKDLEYSVYWLAWSAIKRSYEVYMVGGLNFSSSSGEWSVNT